LAVGHLIPLIQKYLLESKISVFILDRI